MSELDFFPTKGSLSLAAVAAIVGARVPAGADADREVSGLAALERAGPRDVSLFCKEASRAEFLATRAGVCLVREADAADVPVGTIALVTPQPLESFRRLAIHLYLDGAVTRSTRPSDGVHPAAVVHPGARLEAGVSVAAGAIVGPDVEIGTGTYIGVNSVVGAGVRIGRGCAIDSHVSLCAALLGDRVIVHTGAKIGVGGPVATAPAAQLRLGRVIVQDGAEVGANVVIERGALGDTVIGEGARIGALVVVAGEVVLDRHALIEGAAFPRP